MIPSALTSLNGKVAVITGGAGVIGEALAKYLLAGGAKVILADIDCQKGEALAGGLGCEFLQVDVSDNFENQRMIQTAVKYHGRLDLVFLNAGVSSQSLRAPLPYDPANIDVESYRRILAVNIDGPVFGVSAAIPALVDSGGGAIVVTSSVAGLIPWALDPVYTISKHGLVGYIRSLADELSTRGITINAICPGATGHPSTTTGRPSTRRLPPGVALLAPELLAAAMVAVATDGETGRAASVVANRDPVVQLFGFGEVEGF